MAVAAFDHSFSVQQDAKHRLGGNYEETTMTEEEKKQFQESSVMQKQAEMERLTEQWSQERDSKRAERDPTFKPTPGDFSAPKAFEYDSFVNLYEMLGIDEFSSNDEVKVAYRKLSLKYHPDKTSGLTAEQKEEHANIFIDLKNAYLVLGEQATRRQYDKERDKNKAREQVFKTKGNARKRHDATEMLRRIKENQKPPGKTVDVAIECELETFFYGGFEKIERTRKVLNAENQVVDEDYVYKVDIPGGAAEPHECVFANMGDYNVKTKPDTMKFSVKAKPHALLDRQGQDLVLRDAISLGPNLLSEPYISMQTESLQGRFLCIWGRNPFFLEKGCGNAKLRLRIQGEGLPPLGHLEVVCQLSAPGSAAKPQPFTRESARKFLEAVVKAGDSAAVKSKLEQARALWQKSEFSIAQDTVVAAWDEVSKDLLSTGATKQKHGLRQLLDEAMRSVEGEWSLLAKVSSMVSSWPRQDLVPDAKDGTSMSLRSFLEKHCAPGSGFNEPDEDGEEECAASTMSHGKGGLYDSAAMHSLISRRKTRDISYDMNLAPITESVALGIAPDCKLQFYSDKEQSVFAMAFSSEECSRKKNIHTWEFLRENVTPLVQCTVFRLFHIARTILPRQLSDFTVSVKSNGSADSLSSSAMVLKSLGNDAYHRGEFFLAADLYSQCLQLDNLEKDIAAAVLSNRAACSAKVGLLQESLADAKKATELSPTWGRAWSRVGFAAAGLELESYGQEAVDSWFKAVELDASQGSVEALAAAARKMLGTDKAKAAEEKAKGDDAARKESWGVAVAHYTLAIVMMGDLASGDLTMQSKEDLPMWSNLHANRATACTRLRQWQGAIADATVAVASNQMSVKARVRLGAALLAAGLTERAYISFSQAVWMDATSVTAMKAQEACLCMLPSWSTKAAMARKAERFTKDATRPRESTKIYAISDVHFDKDGNDQWVSALDHLAYQEDVLIVAGNLAQSISKIVQALQVLKSKFRRVFYVPGNCETWLNASEMRVHQFADSLSKILALMEQCDDIGVDVFPAQVCKDVSIIPLFSWYNAEFEGEKSTYGKKKDQTPDPLAKWSLDPATQVWKYMLKMNDVHVERPPPGTVITFSHFLPSTQLPVKKEEDMKAMGCEDLEDQMMLVKSKAHVYGHSVCRTVEEHGRTMFFNNNCSPDACQDPKPLLIFDGANGICKERPADMVAVES